jgi:hypothetical protein
VVAAYAACLTPAASPCLLDASRGTAFGRTPLPQNRLLPAARSHAPLARSRLLPPALARAPLPLAPFE